MAVPTAEETKRAKPMATSLLPARGGEEERGDSSKDDNTGHKKNGEVRLCKELPERYIASDGPNTA